MPKIFGLFLILLIATYILFFSSFFKIKSLEVTRGEGCINSQSVMEEAGVIGKNFFLISQNEIEMLIQKKYSCAKKLSVNKVFPSVIRLNVEALPAILKIEDTNLFLNSEGQVTENPQQDKLPILYLDKKSQFVPGQTVEDDTTNFVIKLAIELSKSDFGTASVRIINKGNIAVYNFKNQIAVFSAYKPIGEQVDSLQLVLSKAKIDAGKIAKIDLRFDKPVIVNKPDNVQR